MACVVIGPALFGSLDLCAQRTDTPAARHLERVNRALEAAKQGRLIDAETIVTEELPAAVETPEGKSAYAQRVAELAWHLQDLERFEEARILGEVALEACSAYLETKPESKDPREAARFLSLTGLLLKRIQGNLTQAKEAYLLAYQLDPERQIEALRQVQALEERERVIQERRDESARQKEVRQ